MIIRNTKQKVKTTLSKNYAKPLNVFNLTQQNVRLRNSWLKRH